MIKNFLTELKVRNPVLYRYGWFNAALLAIAFILSFIDPTVISGVNAWIKPMKFAISIVIYCWTFAWLLHYLPSPGKRKFISWGIVICMFMEIALIYLQAARGVRSHFNNTSIFNGIVFSTMGLFIGLNTILNIYTFILFLSKSIQLERPMLYAWRAGQLLFILGAISGGIMAAVLRHSVGVPDGGPGIPFFNWSTLGGDIRSAHFITLHGLQAIPIAALTFMAIARGSATLLVVLFSVAYAALCLWLHWMAFSGYPLIH